MGNAVLRRERNLAKDLAKLAFSNPAKFKQEWAKLLQGWSFEVMRRSRALRSDNFSGYPALPIFAVLKKAERILSLCGDEAQRLVGTETRELLNHECCKGFARAVNHRLYWLVNADSNYQLMKAGTHKPPR